MALNPGTRLGPYEVVALIGAGGMGEVYRARDTKLNRDVAIKVLLPAVANDPDRLARFSREAQVLASLNHPNIAHIHGLEESDGVTALILELVEGEDLAQRIARGAMPLEEALPIARQIAEALEAAHDHGIVHRDLKPANIKVRADGSVKVLDFGLAKAVDPTGGSSATAMNSPTLSIHATEAGIILGTAAYMSPEQARGKAVDRRADIWAFGVVLYEMLTGKRAFAGDDISDTLVSVLRDDPDWSALPADTPPGVAQAMRVCLRKDPRQRVRDISAVRLAMEGAFDATPARATSAATAQDAPRSRLMWPMAAVALLAAGVAGIVVWALLRSTPAIIQPVRFTITPPADLVLATVSPDRDVAISPDGTHLVYESGTNNQTAELHVRAIDQLDSVLLRGITGARWPFISPDSRWIGFYSETTGGGGNELKKVAMTGGPSIALCRVAGPLRGASWGADDAIVFATDDRTTGLLRVPAGGGDPAVLTRPDPQQGEFDHVLPFVLAGGGAVLFTIVPPDNASANFQIAALDLKTGQRKTLVRGGSHAAYVDPSPGSGRAGYLVYAAAGTLRAVRFNPARLEVLSDPVPVVEQVMTKTNGTADFSVSRTGALVYVAGGVGDRTAHRTLVWVDRKGHEEPINAPPRAYAVPRLSPDGTRVALDIRDQDSDIWTWDLARQTLTRLTFDSAADMQPTWTPDSRRIIFASQRAGVPNLFWHSADGTGADQRLTTSVNAQYPNSVTPDGTYVLSHEASPKTSSDVVQVALHDASSARGTGAPVASAQRPSEPLVQTAFIEFDAQISPDGRYLAYQSNESGRPEIYVRPYPKVNDGRWQVSTGGGTKPAWARSGRELFYLDAATTLTSVPVQTTGPTFTAGNPATVFDTKYATPVLVRNYDVSPDGQRFLMIKEGTIGDKTPQARLVVVLNWLEELKARVPTK